jgi:hypothetical protein
VQFTRNPDGIAGALKKIGGLAAGSKVMNPHAPEASHMFFGKALPSLFSTHPPLIERIRRLDPSFNPEVAQTMAEAAGAVPAGAAGFASETLGAAVDQIGNATPAHLDQAMRLIADLPTAVRESVHETWGARAVVYGLLVSRDPESRRVQADWLSAHADAGVAAATARVLPALEGLAADRRLALVDLAIPALRELSPAQYAAFKDNVEALIRADRRIDVFEWTLQRVLMQHLAPAFERVRTPKVRYHEVRQVAPACAVVLSILAYAGASDRGAVATAFSLGARDLGLGDLELLPTEASGLADLDQALHVLDALAPVQKGRLLHACATTVAADRAVTDRETELVRAIADSLGCPMPPVLAGQKLV